MTYEETIEASGARILVLYGLDRYSGDALVLAERDGKVGFLTFGYGSCSYCDRLESCNSHAERLEVGRDIVERGTWDTPAGLFKFLRERDGSTSFYGEHDWAPFKAAALAYLTTCYGVS